MGLNTNEKCYYNTSTAPAMHTDEEVTWSEVKWSEVKWSEVKWSEVKLNLSGTALAPMTRFFFFFLMTDKCFVPVGSPLRREDGSVICSVFGRCSDSQRTNNHTLLWYERTGFPFRRLSRLAATMVGVFYSNPPPHAELPREWSTFKNNLGSSLLVRGTVLSGRI
jgi:hypothetical protein